MQTRFDRFTRRARRVLSLAQAEARRFKHGHIEPEHLLLGLTHLDDGAAALFLRRANVDLAKIRMQVEQLLEHGSDKTSDTIALSLRTKRVIVVAIAEADRMGHRHIGTQHLLLGLLQEGEGAAYKVLTEWGVTVDNARAQISQSPLGEEESLKEQADIALEQFTEEERKILSMRFGLVDGKRWTVEEVARELGVTRERIRQVEAKALGTKWWRARDEDDLLSTG